LIGIDERRSEKLRLIPNPFESCNSSLIDYVIMINQAYAFILKAFVERINR
jgi:hypothetical protein